MHKVLAGYSRCWTAQDTPRDRWTRIRNRTALAKVLLCAITLSFGLCLGWNLPVPDTIQLPDSLGPLWGPPRPYHVAYSGSGDIYVASESSDIIVVNGKTFDRVKRIVTNTSVGSMAYVAGHNRLYCSYPEQHRLGIIDCLSNNIVGSIPITTGADLLCHSSVSDKLYCCDTLESSVSVVGCAADTVLKVISVGESVSTMTYDPTTNKLYVATADAVQAISCTTDSIVASIGAVKGASGFYMNKRRQKLYSVRGVDTAMYVISTKLDSVVARIPLGVSVILPHLACNETTDRLYGVVDGYISEFDCAGDTFLRDVNGPPGVDLVCDTVKNRLYYLNSLDYERWLTTFDCSSLTVCSDVLIEPLAEELVFDRSRGRVLCAGGEEEGVLAVFDCKRDSLDPIGVVPLAGRMDLVHGICHNSVSHKLYYRWGEAVGGIGVIDEQSNRLAKQVILPQHTAGDLAYSPTSNKLYCASGSGLAILDGSTDSLLKYDRSLSPEVMCWCPDSNRLFCFCWQESGMFVAVLDCRTDSVIKELDVSRNIYEFEYLDNGLLLCNGDQNFTLIDCRRDTIVVENDSLGGLDLPVAHTGDGKKVYLGTYGRLKALDAHTLSLLDTVSWPYSGHQSGMSFACSDSVHKLYWFAGDSTLAIDTRSDTVTARLGLSTRGTCFGRSGRYLFCPGTADSELTVYDARADTVVAVYPTLENPIRVTATPEQGRIYAFFWCGRDEVLAYPDTLMNGVCEKAGPSSSWPKQTLVRGVLFMPGASIAKSQVSSSLLDVSGRKVLSLHPGANDVRTLSPGVYFVREAPKETFRKVVIAK